MPQPTDFSGFLHQSHSVSSFETEVVNLLEDSSRNPNFDFYAHLNKYKLCEAQGVKFLAIFEDEWANPTKQAIIKAMIRWRCGKFEGTRLHARKLDIVRLDKNRQFEPFFAENHLDGHAKASYAYALIHEGQTVMACSVRSNFRGEREIARLATHRDFQVNGGAGKLIAAIKKEIGETPLITFSNNRIGNGDVYKKLGFKFVQNNAPSYYYTDGIVRLWRYRCKRINEPEILSKFPTEKAQALGGVFAKRLLGEEKPLYQISDYGHKKWSL